MPCSSNSLITFAQGLCCTGHTHTPHTPNPVTCALSDICMDLPIAVIHLYTPPYPQLAPNPPHSSPPPYTPYGRHHATTSPCTLTVPPLYVHLTIHTRPRCCTTSCSFVIIMPPLCYNPRITLEKIHTGRRFARTQRFTHPLLYRIPLAPTV